MSNKSASPPDDLPDPPGSVEQDLEEEIAFHLRMRTEHFLRAGLSESSARSQARWRFGDVDSIRDEILRQEVSPPRRLFVGLGTELRGAVRSLTRRPLFSLAVIALLGAGIAASTFIFSIVSGVLLKPLPYEQPQQVAMIWGDLPQIDLGFREQPVGGTYFWQVRNGSRAFSGVSAFRSRRLALGTEAAPERLDGIEATGEFFRALGVHPAVGRFFTIADEPDGLSRVAVLSYDLWQRRFGNSPGILNQTITLDGEPFQVIGVAPPGFAFPRGAEMPGNFQFPSRAEIWIPLLPATRMGPWDLAMVGRLRDSVSMAGAQEDMNRITRAMEEQLPAAKGWLGTRVVPLRAQLMGDVKPMLLSLFAAVGVLLLIACLNAAQLLLAQVETRRKELAVRTSLGASPGRIARTLLVEVGLLALFAGVAGAVLGAAAVRVFSAHPPVDLPLATSIAFDWRVLGAAIVVTILTAVGFGVAPALAGTRVPLAEVLRRGDRGRSDLGLGIRARRGLIVSEVALSLVLVAGAGQLAHSLSNQLHSALGFTRSNGVTFEITLPPIRYPEQQFQTYREHPAAANLFTQLLAGLREIPGVQEVALGKPLPMSGAQEATGFTPEGAAPRAENESSPTAEYTVASPRMFAALGSPLSAGRDFDQTDQEDSPPVVIINQAMARTIWPGQDPLGKRLRLGSATDPGPWITVIGVASDIKRYSMTQEPRPEMFVPYTQKPYPSFSTMQFVIRSESDAAQLLPAVRKELERLDPSVPVANVRTLQSLVDDASARARFATSTMAAFGVAALILAVVGLYSVIAFGVHQRRQEFAVRRALGADTSNILRLVISEGLRLAYLGVMIGVALALGAGRALRSLLYQVSAFDLPSLGAAIGILVIAAVLACLLPAQSATRVEPRAALGDG